MCWYCGKGFDMCPGVYFWYIMENQRNTYNNVFWGSSSIFQQLQLSIDFAYFWPIVVWKITGFHWRSICQLDEKSQSLFRAEKSAFETGYCRQRSLQHIESHLYSRFSSARSQYGFQSTVGYSVFTQIKRHFYIQFQYDFHLVYFFAFIFLFQLT